MDETYAPEIVMDRESSTPLYEQIARPIEAAILSGELPAGARIEEKIAQNIALAGRQFCRGIQLDGRPFAGGYACAVPVLFGSGDSTSHHGLRFQRD